MALCATRTLFDRLGLAGHGTGTGTVFFTYSHDRFLAVRKFLPLALQAEQGGIDVVAGFGDGAEQRLEDALLDAQAFLNVFVVEMQGQQTLAEGALLFRADGYFTWMKVCPWYSNGFASAGISTNTPPSSPFTSLNRN